MDYFYLAIAILAEVAATSALKASDAFTRPTFSAIVIVGYGTAYYFLSPAFTAPGARLRGLGMRRHCPDRRHEPHRV